MTTKINFTWIATTKRPRVQHITIEIAASKPSGLVIAKTLCSAVGEWRVITPGEGMHMHICQKCFDKSDHVIPVATPVHER